MKIPNVKRLMAEDYPKDVRKWISPLLSSINLFFETVSNSLRGNLTFNENIRSYFRDLSFTTSGTYSSGDFTEIVIKSPWANKINGIMVAQYYRQGDTYTVNTGAVTIDWHQINENVKIKYISGLEDSTEYVIKTILF